MMLSGSCIECSGVTWFHQLEFPIIDSYKGLMRRTLSVSVNNRTGHIPATLIIHHYHIGQLLVIIAFANNTFLIIGVLDWRNLILRLLS